MKRKQSDRDAEAGLREALMALVEMARREDACTCRPCRRLRELGRVLDAKSATPGLPFEMRPAPPIRPRRDRP